MGSRRQALLRLPERVRHPLPSLYFCNNLRRYSSVNQGHSHPAIVAAAVKQMQVHRRPVTVQLACVCVWLMLRQDVSLSSRAFHNDVFPVYSKCAPRTRDLTLTQP